MLSSHAVASGNCPPNPWNGGGVKVGTGNSNGLWTVWIEVKDDGRIVWSISYKGRNEEMSVALGSTTTIPFGSNNQLSLVAQTSGSKNNTNITNFNLSGRVSDGVRNDVTFSCNNAITVNY